MEEKEIVKRVEEILLKHEGNTSEGAIYWNFEWVGGKQIPAGGGGYRQEGGECVYADKAFYEEMANFISQELDKAREEGYEKGRRYQMELNEMLNGVSVQENTLEKGKEYVVISKETYNKLTTK